MLSIVIPTYNSAQTLEKTLNSVKAYEGEMEIIVSDNASSDATTAIAVKAGAQITCGAKGRGPQLALGAKMAKGDWLLFLHGDTILEKGWQSKIGPLIGDQAQDHAYYFQFALDNPSKDAQRLEKMVAWRCRTLHLPYGDQGLLLTRELYENIGGYRDIPLMEDVDLVRKLGKKRLHPLSIKAITSAEKFTRDGYFSRSARNLFCLSLFYLGVSPSFIARLYGK